MFRKISLGLLFAITLMVGFITATFAQQSSLLVPLQPFLVDINQTIPFSLAFTLPDTGETVTIPSEIDVALSIQLRADGSISPTVQVAKAFTPTIQVAVPTPIPNESIINDIAWTVISAQDTGQSITFSMDDYTQTTDARFIRLELRAENVGKVQADPLLDRLDIVIVDDEGRAFGEMDYDYYYEELCMRAKVNPGLAVNCVMAFDVPQAATGLTLSITSDDESVAIPLHLE